MDRAPGAMVQGEIMTIQECYREAALQRFYWALALAPLFLMLGWAIDRWKNRR